MQRKTTWSRGEGIKTIIIEYQPTPKAQLTMQISSNLIEMKRKIKLLREKRKLEKLKSKQVKDGVK